MPVDEELQKQGEAVVCCTDQQPAGIYTHVLLDLTERLAASSDGREMVKGQGHSLTWGRRRVAISVLP